jgi:serine/threonine protein kinase
MADSPVAVSLKHIQTQPTPPSQLNSRIPPSVEAVILKALAKDPNDRYQQAILLTLAYKNALQVEQVSQQGAERSSVSKLDHLQRRHLPLILTALLCLILLSICLYFVKLFS